MTTINWNPLSIAYLVEAVLALSIACYFLFRTSKADSKRTSADTRVIAIVFVLIFVGLLLQFLSVSLDGTWANFALPWVSPIAAAAMCGFLYFAFTFGRTETANAMSRNLVIALFVLIVLTELYVAWQRHLLLLDGTVLFRQNWIKFPFASFLLLAPIFFFKNLLAQRILVKSEAEDSRRLSALAFCLQPAVHSSKLPEAIRAFFYVSLVPFSLGIVLFLRSLGIIEWYLALVVSCWLFLFTLASLAIGYLNFMPEQSSFRTKLIGVSLTSVLMILAAISWFVGPAYIDLYSSVGYVKPNTTIEFVPHMATTYSAIEQPPKFDNNFGSRLQLSESPVPSDFDFPFFGASYNKFFVSGNGFLSFHKVPKIDDVEFDFATQPAIFGLSTRLMPREETEKSGVFIKHSPSAITITWFEMLAKQSGQGPYTFQVVLNSAGNIQINFRDVPPEPELDMFNPTSYPSLTGIVAAQKPQSTIVLTTLEKLTDLAPFQNGAVVAYGHDFRAFLSRIYMPIGYFVIGSSLMIIFVFSWFFTTNLRKPLQELLYGVDRILSGKLDTQISAKYADEIGFLANSFNAMASSQRQLIDGLEDLVIQRTEETNKLAAKAARLEERNLLSQELHDAVSQTLFSSSLIAEDLPRLRLLDDKSFGVACADIQRLNQNALREMRQLLERLRSAEQDTQPVPFSPVLHSAIEEFQTIYPGNVTIDITNDENLPRKIHHVLKRILQECLSNIGRHANAENVEVLFDGLHNQAFLTIRDNGDGFSVEKRKEGSFGLEIIRERASEIGATIEINSVPEAGTEINLIWIGRQDVF